MSKDPAAVKLGRKGGQSTSPAKKRSGKINMAKARLTRWSKQCPSCGENARFGKGNKGTTGILCLKCGFFPAT